MPDIYGAKINNTQYDFSDGTKVTHDLLKDTVGWSGKNLLDDESSYSFIKSSVRVKNFMLHSPIYVEGGAEYIISFNIDSINLSSGNFRVVLGSLNSTVSSEFIITPSQSTGKVEGILIINPNLATTITRCYMFIDIVADSESAISISEIMLRKADILDDTYEPYHKSVEEEYGEKITSTVSGNTVTFTSDLIGSDSVPDGPYIKDVLTGLQGVAYNGTTITYTLTDTSADGKEAYLWIRN